MNREDIIRMAREAGSQHQGELFVPDAFVLRFAAIVAAEKEQQMLRDGWRQCAKGQRTTQHCGLLDAAVKAEREACAKVCDAEVARLDMTGESRAAIVAGICAAAIRARGEVKP